MERNNERGGSRISALFWLAVLVAIIYALWNAGPVYLADFQFSDALQEIARTPKGRNVEALVADRLDKAIKEQELQEYLSVEDCQVTTTDTSRTIVCSYEREVKFLPGYKRVVKFNKKVVGPLI
jgi:hypothetical protein